MKWNVETLGSVGKIKASDIMTAPVMTVRMWDSIHDVAKIFVENNISCAAVVDMDDIPLGVITKTDLARYGSERATLVVAEKDKKPARARKTFEDVDRAGFHVEPEEATIEHWMTPALFDVSPSTIFAAVVKKMVKNGLHHILVTEGDKKKIKGIITSFDVMMVIERALSPADN